MAGPVHRGAFALFLLFIGIALSLSQAGKKDADSAIGHAAQIVAFGWRPIYAYLAGKKEMEGNEGEEGREEVAA